MPHQCVRCNTFYDDGASEILKGCKCGGKLFFYIRKEKLEEARNMTSNITEDEAYEIEKDVLDLVGERKNDDSPVVLDLESIRVLRPGKYELDLVHLFKGDPVVFKTGDGKYVIDIVETFKRAGQKHK
jgi:predicted  nucleic acid-binding Zn-ribbon protein